MNFVYFWGSVMKLVFRFFLSLYFLLVSGYGYVYANTYQEHIGYSASKIIASQQPDAPGLLQDNLIFTNRTVPAHTENAHEKIDVQDNEDEEEELTSFKEYLELGNAVTNFFHSLTFGDYSRYVKKSLPFCKHFSYLSSDTYIILCVIRV